MATLTFILSELFSLVSDAILCLLHNLNSLLYIIMILQLCRTGLGDMSGTRMTTLTAILSELFPRDGFRCNFMSSP